MQATLTKRRPRKTGEAQADANARVELYKELFARGQIDDAFALAMVAGSPDLGRLAKDAGEPRSEMPPLPARTKG